MMGGRGGGEVVAVVTLAFGGTAEDGVCGCDFDEACGRSGRVRGVVVWVVVFGEVEILSVVEGGWLVGGGGPGGLWMGLGKGEG